MSYLRFVNIRKEFVKDQTDTTVALKDVSLEIGKNSLVSIVGPSGCGKSTLLQVAAGLLVPTSGQVLLEGREITSPPFEIIYIFQQYTKSLFPWMTVEKNIAFGLENRQSLARKEVEEKCAEYVSLVGLEGFERHFPWQLSGGMQQRVAVARALVCQPAILLMDEPFGSVDALTRVVLQDLVLDLWRKLHLTIVFVTHDIEEAIYMAGRVVVLSRSPAVVLDDVPIELPYPRDQLQTRESEKYLAYRHSIFSQIFQLGREAVQS